MGVYNDTKITISHPYGISATRFVKFLPVFYTAGTRLKISNSTD